MNLRQFYVKFVYFTDRILPLVSSTEVPILVVLFSRSIAAGEERCSISYRDINLLTNQSVPTIKKVLRVLREKNLIRLSNLASGRKAKTYEIIWPDPLPYSERMSSLYRDPEYLISKLIGKIKIEGLFDKLTQEDKDLLDITIRDLSEDEKSSLRDEAQSLLVGEGSISGLDRAYKELIVKKYFGRHRLIKYETKRDLPENGK